MNSSIKDVTAEVLVKGAARVKKNLVMESWPAALSNGSDVVIDMYCMICVFWAGFWDEIQVDEFVVAQYFAIDMPKDCFNVYLGWLQIIGPVRKIHLTLRLDEEWWCLGSLKVSSSCSHQVRALVQGSHKVRPIRRTLDMYLRTVYRPHHRKTAHWDPTWIIQQPHLEFAVWVQPTQETDAAH